MVLFLLFVHLDAEYRGQQFSVLSYFLFYIDDLSNCLSSRQPRMSADDKRITSG